MEKKIIASIITIIITIALIGLVIFINKPKQAPEEIIPEPVIETHNNVYILSCENNELRYVEHGVTQTAKGCLDEDHQTFTGFADIRVNSDGEFVDVINYKTQSAKGQLLAYSDTSIKITDDEWMPLSKDLQVFRTYEDILEVCELDEFVVGATKLLYFTDGSEICGLIQDEKTETEDIRVVIKNAETKDIFYPEVYLFSKSELRINDQVFDKATTFDAGQYMAENDLCRLDITSDSPIAMTDSKGKKKSEYYEGTISIVNEDPTKVPSAIDQKLVVVNTLPIETYVRYVLPSEMPKSFGFEAQKAQAVCARTYAYSQMKNGQYALYGANLDDSTMYQVYNAKGVSDITDKACEQTLGLVASQNQELITCYYSSTSPGFSHGLEAWGDEEVNYLGYHNQTENPYEDLTLQENVKLALDEAPQSYDSESPFYRWMATLSFSKANIVAAADPELGQPLAFNITGRTAAGFVNKMEISYTKGTKELESELDVRRFFGKFLKELTLNNDSKRKDFTLIPSAFFVEENLSTDFQIKALSGKKLTLVGGGFGHGIGLSQYGADGMSKAGKSFDEILNFYYDNIELTDVKELDAFK